MRSVIGTLLASMIFVHALLECTNVCCCAESCCAESRHVFAVHSEAVHSECCRLYPRVSRLPGAFCCRACASVLYRGHRYSRLSGEGPCRSPFCEGKVPHDRQRCRCRCHCLEVVFSSPGVRFLFESILASAGLSEAVVCSSVGNMVRSSGGAGGLGPRFRAAVPLGVSQRLFLERFLI